jgi:hypothetical protein
LERSSAVSGRSLTQEFEISTEVGLLIRKMMSGSAPMPLLQALTEFYRAGPQLAAFMELLGRTMLDVGETIQKANAYSGHAKTSWIDDPYAWNQAVDAAQHILALSRHEGGEPHGLFASSDYPENLAKELGVQSADGILEVMRGRHEPEPGTNETIVASQWAPQVRERLESIGDRLDRHPSPDEYNLTTNKPLGPAE